MIHIIIECDQCCKQLHFNEEQGVGPIGSITLTPDLNNTNFLSRIIHYLNEIQWECEFHNGQADIHYCPECIKTQRIANLERELKKLKAS